MNNDQKIQQLERQVAELLQWKEEKTRQQIKYPLDEASVRILNKHFILFDSYLYFLSASGDELPNILIKHDGVTDLISVYRNMKVFIADPTTDVITSMNHGFVDGQTVALYTTDTLPNPLSDLITYYVKNSTSNTLQLSLTLGGAVINITDIGTGIHYMTIL